MAQFLDGELNMDANDMVNTRFVDDKPNKLDKPKRGRLAQRSDELYYETNLNTNPVESYPRQRNLRKKSNVEPGIDEKLLHFMDMKMKAKSQSSRARRPKVPPILSPTTSSSICDKRLQIAFDILSQFNDNDLTEPSDVTALCDFFPVPVEPFNFGCPIYFTPDDGFLTPDFFNSIGNEIAAEAYTALTKYCECYQGYELGCAEKIPHGSSPSTFSYGIGQNSREVFIPSYSEYIPFSTPASRAEYCKFAAVWNGDISPDDFSLSKELGECGCFFVATAKDMLRGCPGIDLGSFWNSTMVD
ncbi:hypothetical protein ACHAXS_010785 [Conticribra weissflogii]